MPLPSPLRSLAACSVLILASCDSPTYQLIPKSASWEVAPPIPDPMIPPARATLGRVTAGFDRSYTDRSTFSFQASGQSLPRRDFPLLIDSNTFYGSFSADNLWKEESPAPLHVRFSRWNSAWCIEGGATLRAGAFAFTPSFGIEILETNYQVVDSSVTISHAEGDPRLVESESNRNSENGLSPSPMLSLAVARTEGMLVPWIAVTLESRGSISRKHSQSGGSSSKDEVGYSSNGGIAQAMAGLRFHPLPSFSINTKVGIARGTSNFDMHSVQGGVSMTYVR